MCMLLDVHSLPDDPTELKQIIASLSSRYEDTSEYRNALILAV